MDRCTDRHHHAELHLVAQALAENDTRFVEPIPDIDAWLQVHRHRRRSTTLLVVWDHTEAAILTREHGGLEIRVAASLLNWARRSSHAAVGAD